ncbi:MAG: tRNA pseudouridine(38-40) synthase TruA [Chloroflexi bacterium]|nr:tRNA pseudouridine(38-40) synthase TruA [Chloroflexota bacterium]
MTVIKKFALTCQYDGTSYQGFQSQKNQKTIQEKLECSLFKVTNKRLIIEYAGRTDSGVHATHQVISFTTEWNHKINDLENALNSNLPDDIAVNNIMEVPNTFHPRKSAISRSYEYTISTSVEKDIFIRNYSYHYPNKLDLVKIQEGLNLIKGKHDFSNFCKKESLPENSIRYIYDNSIEILDKLMIFKFKGSSFLRHQIRFMVGFLLAIGRGKHSLNELKSLLKSENRAKTLIKHNVSPRGLCLTLVEYDGFSFKKNMTNE